MLTSPHPAPAVLIDDHYDQRPRWRPGERFHTVFEQTVDRLERDGEAERPAVERADGRLSYRELDDWANRLADRLATVGTAPGDRVGLLFGHTPAAYAAMLALSKLGAAWVPFDAGFPPDRIAFICQDAGIRAVLTQDDLAPLLAGLDVRIDIVDECRGFDDRRRPIDDDADPLAYVVYTSGTTGRPKGVPVRHSAICNFVRVAAEVYGYGPGDRVYQGLTMAFDFSVEEIWVPLAAGATLVPGPVSGALVGAELTQFLREHRVTALCCVPTLLETIDPDLPDIRLLLVSGEACPKGLVDRWARPERRFLNVYGPTETTVTATWSVLTPGDPVTIGVPLPTYSAVVLDPESHEPLPPGDEGELAVAGIGLSPGYLGRDDLTAKAFVEDPLDLPNNPSHRLYCTGDLVHIDAEGRIRYDGRIDTQVKIRGYRIELGEIESALLAVAGVAQAAVSVHRNGGPPELAAFYTSGTDVDRDGIMTALRRVLPPFMVPTYLERIDAMPMLPSQKIDRKALPAPSGPRYTAQGEVVPPEGPVETLLAAEVGRVLAVPDVSVEADLFADLGADSLRVAQLCAAVRATPELAGVTTRLVYEQPTVRALAAALTVVTDAPAIPARRRPAPHIATRFAHIACGAAQAAAFVVTVLLGAGIGWLGYAWMLVPPGPGGLLVLYLRAVALIAGSLVVFTLLPVLARRIPGGRSTTEPIPVWTLRYLRFWLVRATVRYTPASLFMGSPLYNVYLRMLGAKVGRHALVLTAPPVCADLVTIGEGAVIGEEVAFDGYKAEAGWVLRGHVDIGAHAVLGQHSVLDIDTAVGDGAELAHASALVEGQRVPAGRRWHGSPALEVGPVAPRPDGPVVGSGPRALYAAGQLAILVLVAGPLLIGTIALAVIVNVTDPRNALLFGTGLVLVDLLVRIAAPRLLVLPLQPDRDYPLYGLHWTLFRLVIRTSNSKFFNELFGDSSAILGYLSAIGIHFPNRIQTGSNFGTAQKQHVPTFCTIGGGSLVSDGLTMPNGIYSAQSFRLGRIRVGERVFMGNGVVYPPGAALGDDVLLATKVMVPTDGPVRSGVGLLGSPAFEIPRTVTRDRLVADEHRDERLRADLHRKNRHNLATAVLFLLLRFTAVYVFIVPLAVLVPDGWLGVAAAIALGLIADIALLVVVDQLTRGFHRLRPLSCSIYDVHFWRHERYWKLADPAIVTMFDGTPFKPLMWRLLGARVGRMLWDDGGVMPERSLVTLGDGVTLAARSVLHGHSLEDGVFKSGRIALGSGVTVGPAAVVHYDVEAGAGVTVGPDAFLMKGERAPAGSEWQGNPAVLVGARQPLHSKRHLAPHRRRRRVGRSVLIGATAFVVMTVTAGAFTTAMPGAVEPVVDAAPASVTAAAAEPATATPAGVVTLVGDTSGLQGTVGADAWRSLVARRSHTVVKTPEPGVAYEAASETNQPYLAAATRVDPASKAVVFVGAAHGAATEAPESEVGANSVFDRTKEILAAARAQAPRARLIVVAPVPDSPVPAESLTALRDDVRRAAEAAQAQWLDPAGGIAVGTRHPATAGATPSEAAAERIGTAIAQAINPPSVQ